LGHNSRREDSNSKHANWKENSPLRIHEQPSSPGRSTAYHISDLEVCAQFSKVSINAVGAAQIFPSHAPQQCKAKGGNHNSTYIFSVLAKFLSTPRGLSRRL